MLKTKSIGDLSGEVVNEHWIKPPKVVHYTNAHILEYFDNTLICQFQFPDKYSTRDFYIGDIKVLKRHEMFYGIRYFYADRFYSLLEFYSKDGRLTAYYIDITLPAILEKDNVLIADLKIDFFIMPDKKTFYLLDEDELEEAKVKKLLSDEEISICNKVTEKIKSHIEGGNFDDIFTDYDKSSYKEWSIYDRHI